MVITLIVPFTAFAQEHEDVEKRLQEMEAVYMKLISRQRLIDSIYYREQKKKLDVAITLGSTLSTKWRTLQDNISVSKGLGKITAINSIGKDNALGFDFDKVLEELVQTHLTVEIDNLNETPAVKQELKSRWKENVAKILHNPIIQAFVNTNPLTSVASSLISSAIGFTHNSIDTYASLILTAKEPLPAKYKDFVSSWNEKISVEATSLRSTGKTKNLMSQQAIENFSESIKPYIELFDKMSNSNMRFAVKLEEASVFNSSYSEIISTYDKQMMLYLKISRISDGPDRINSLLRVDETALLPGYREAVEHAELKEALKLANEYNHLKDKVNELSVNYYQIHIDYFEEYIRHLDSALSNTDSGKTKFDKTKILQAREFIAEQIKQCKKAKADIVKGE